MLDLQARLSAKFAVDQAMVDGLTDAATGAYNAKGLERRAQELVASAARHHVLLACAAFVPEMPCCGSPFSSKAAQMVGSQIELITVSSG